MAVFEVISLPDAPVAAAAQFYAKYLPLIEIYLMTDDGPLTLVFPPADHPHHGWRLAAVQSLAREYAPRRVNAICGPVGVAIVAAERFLASAEGLTGQYVTLDSAGAGPVLS